MWRELVQRYAICAREFSDAVALLGQRVHLGPEQSRQLLEDIRAKQELCIAVAGEIDRYAKQKADACTD
jgi:hypothetical protein